MSAIDEVKQRTDIVEVIGQYTKLTKVGRTYKGLCPFHTEKHASFFVYPEQQTWHCFGACSTGGDVFSFVMKKEDIPFGDALRLLAQKASITIPSKYEREGEKEEKEELYQINEVTAQYFHDLLLNSPVAAKARSYIDSRGFSPQTATDFQLGFSMDSWESLKQHLMQIGYPESSLLKSGIIVEAENGKTHDRFRGRLIFPIRDARGHTIGFGGRVLDDSLPKYLNSPQTPIFDKSSILYGIDRAAKAIRLQDKAIIVEGYIDVVTAHQNGIENVVASMGTAITETQVNTLKKLSKNLVLVLDADEAGKQAMSRGGEIATKPPEEATRPKYKYASRTAHLNEQDIRNRPIVGERLIDFSAEDIEIKVAILPEDKDPDDIIRQDISLWKKMLEEATPWEDHIFKVLTTNLELKEARGKTLAVERLVPVIGEILNPVRKSHYIQELAHLVKVDVNKIEAALSRMKPSAVTRRIQAPHKEAVSQITRPLISNPREEYLLTLLLRNPELREKCQDFSPEYFENSVNREIFNILQKSADVTTIRENLDIAIHDYIDLLSEKDLLTDQLEEKFDYTLLKLKEDHYKRLEANKAEQLAQEAESGGTDAELARLEEQGIETSIQLGEVQKKQRWSEIRR